MHNPSLIELLASAPVLSLVNETPNPADRSRVAQFMGQIPTLALAGLWLRFQFFDESHHISQDHSSREGSYWHAILHRREPDDWNAKYWFRKVGRHAVMDAIPGYDPIAFVDDCEKHRGTGSSEEQKLLSIQLQEWQLLFDWCLTH